MKSSKSALLAMLALGLGLGSAPVFASGGSVAYACQNGRSLEVNYQFNSVGIPTQAQARLDGANRVMNYDLNRSDNVDTYFKDDDGYTISTSNMTSGNYQKAAINVLSPDSRILYKSCMPKRNASSAGRSSRAAASNGSVAYVCQNNKRINIGYAFNAQGIPTRAQVRLNGANRVMNYDLDRSDDVDTYFKDSAGYRISTSNMTSDNYHQAGVMIMSPNDEILYKGCTPASR